MRKVERIILLCKQCGCEYKVYPCQKDISKFCNRSCQGKYQINKYADKFLTRDKHGENHPMWGKKHTEESKKKMSLSAPDRSGENSPTWKGGITPKHHGERKTKKYMEWKRSILERDNYTCSVCGTTEGIIQVDHIKPFILFPELRLEMSNGQTICKPCHLKKNSTDMKLIRKEAKHIWDKKTL